MSDLHRLTDSKRRHRLCTSPQGNSGYISFTPSNKVNNHYWHFNKTFLNLFSDLRKLRMAETRMSALNIKGIYWYEKCLLVSINIFVSKALLLFLLASQQRISKYSEKFRKFSLALSSSEQRRRKLMIFFYPSAGLYNFRYRILSCFSQSTFRFIEKRSILSFLCFCFLRIWWRPQCEREKDFLVEIFFLCYSGIVLRLLCNFLYRYLSSTVFFLFREPCMWARSGTKYEKCLLHVFSGFSFHLFPLNAPQQFI